jgi:hypothetical protein
MLAFLPAAVIVALAAAQSGAGAQDQLRNIKTLKCRFSTLATGTWLNGASRADVKPSTLSVGFDSIDVSDGTADTIGQFGPLHITVRLSGSTLHFMQMDNGGPLYLTTVFAAGRDKLPDGKLRAVHTRHEYTEVSLPGFTSRPEQYYGECEATSAPPAK